MTDIGLTRPIHSDLRWTEDVSMKIQFHIITVSYNSGDKLIQTLNSIYKQDYWDYDVIIEDSESTDGSIEALKDILRDNTHIFVAKDKGIYDGMNLALSRIDEIKGAYGKSEATDDTACEESAEYVLFLNCGDVLHDKQVLGAVADAIEADIKESSTDSNRPHIYYGDQYNLKTESKVSSVRKINEFALYRNVPCHQVCFYEKSLFTDRAYNTEYKVRADYEHFLYCVYKQNAEASYIDVVISDYEGGGYSESKENKKISAVEHKKITDMYMGRRANKYKMILTLTGAGLRTRLAENQRTAGIYNKIKTMIYRR